MNAVGIDVSKGKVWLLSCGLLVKLLLHLLKSNTQPVISIHLYNSSTARMTPYILFSDLILITYRLKLDLL